MGRVILVPDFEAFYEEYQRLESAFYAAIDRKEKDRSSVNLTVLPFPRYDEFPKELPAGLLNESAAEVLWAASIVSAELEKRFEARIRILLESVQEEKRFYASHLTELEKITEKGIYLAGAGKGRRVGPDCIITPQLLGRIQAARVGILCYSAEEIRQSTSAKEDVINQCGAIL